uniref:Uncharacterized protein n=1 Tax=Pseudictyota dubia TaxID=2749911 RepID=A0A7R9VK95_9STRA
MHCMYQTLPATPPKQQLVIAHCQTIDSSQPQEGVGEQACAEGRTQGHACEEGAWVGRHETDTAQTTRKQQHTESKTTESRRRGVGTKRVWVCTCVHGEWKSQKETEKRNG